MTRLCWQPIHAAIAERANSGDRLVWAVVPFAKLLAVKRLFEQIPRAETFKLILRWRPSDLVTRVSDLEVYEYLASSGLDLYIHPRIHLKLFVFESNLALVTSGNLTDKGLGYCALDDANVEIGATATLGARDWIELYRVASDSRLVTAALYNDFANFVKSHPPLVPIPTPDLLGPRKTYTLASLPATDSPTVLADFYASMHTSEHPGDLVRRAYHDLAVFDIPDGLTVDQLHRSLATAFRNNPFVRDFVEYLQEAGSLRFGAVNDWIHAKCEDVPLPYRWEVKPSTAIFYNWLSAYFSEISWDRPHYSQVVYWAD